MKTLPLAPAPHHVATIRGTGKVYVSSRKEPKIWVLDQEKAALLDEFGIRGTGHEMNGLYAISNQYRLTERDCAEQEKQSGRNAVHP